MGKGTIISAVGDGSYTVTVEYDTAAITAMISLLTTKISDFQAVIDDPESTDVEVKIAKIRQLSAQKRKDFLEDTSKVPTSENITAWCADYTTDLTGSVGTIEVGRERANGVNIQPGYESNAVYSGTRDGQLVPTMAQSAAATFYNLAMLPGAQKWIPMFRYGTITEIDYDLDTCSVTIDSLTSSQQGLNINQDIGLSDVPIEYMDCNSAAFAVDDEIIVEFTPATFPETTKKVIGFKSDPVPCSFNLAVKIESINGYSAYTKSGFSVRLTQPIPEEISDKGGYTEGYRILCTKNLDANGVAVFNSEDIEIDPSTGEPYVIDETKAIHVWLRNTSKFRYYTEDWKGAYPDYCISEGGSGFYDGIWFYGNRLPTVGGEVVEPDYFDFQLDEVWGQKLSINLLSVGQSKITPEVGEDISGWKVQFVNVKSIYEDWFFVLADACRPENDDNESRHELKTRITTITDRPSYWRLDSAVGCGYNFPPDYIGEAGWRTCHYDDVTYSCYMHTGLYGEERPVQILSRAFPFPCIITDRDGGIPVYTPRTSSDERAGSCQYGLVSSGMLPGETDGCEGMTAPFCGGPPYPPCDGMSEQEISWSMQDIASENL